MLQNERKHTNLKRMASMKVKAGIKSDIAVAKVGELKPIPKNLSI